YLKGEISDLALELIFDEINSNKINKKDFSYISLSAIELRILLNIATNADSYKNIDKVKIMNRCINQEENREVKIAAYNNLTN
ncbi:MAG: transcriptional regulator, partial [Peptoniphilaceae bacterium]|nr:transcriptional regulator [Peptoniphilaceae bacterium]